jgi:hypothetical protein
MIIISQVRFVNIIYSFQKLGSIIYIYESHPTPINSCDYLNNIVWHDDNDIKEDIKTTIDFPLMRYQMQLNS